MNTLYTSKVHTRRNGCLSLMLGLTGIATGIASFVFLPGILMLIGGGFGLLLLVIGQVAEKQECTCQACGNAVAATSKLCPACGAIFGQDPEKLALEQISAKARDERLHTVMLVALKYTLIIGGCIAAAWALLYFLLARGH